MADPPKTRVGMTQVEVSFFLESDPDWSSQENACWRERVKHENAKKILNENFDFNPKNCKYPPSGIQVPMNIVTI